VPTYLVTTNDEQYAVSVDEHDAIKLNGEPMSIDVQSVDANTYSVVCNGASIRIVAHKAGNVYQALVDSQQLDVLVESERDTLLRSAAQTTVQQNVKLEIHAPMPALVVKVEVNVGDDVHPGTGLLILEAMKMENEIRAHQSAKVKQIFVASGKTVEKGELLMLLE